MKNQTQALEHAGIQQYCKVARLPTVAANFVSLAEQPVKAEPRPHPLSRSAVGHRVRRARPARHRKPHPRAGGRWLYRAKEPIVLIGECGTGKTHLATGLCVAAYRQKRRVRFTTAATLVNELLEARQNNQVRKLMTRWQRDELIALDEVGYVPLADIGAGFLFQVIAE